MDLKKIINIENCLSFIENIKSGIFNKETYSTLDKSSDKGSDRFLENSWLKDIAPSRLISNPSYLLIDKGLWNREYQTTIHFIRYPNFIYWLWLKRILDLQTEYNLSIFIYPTNAEDKILDLENELKKINDTLSLWEMWWKEPDDKLRNLNQKQQEINFFIKQLKNKEDSYLYLSIVIRYKGKTKKDLHNVLNAVMGKVQDMGTWTIIDEVKCRQIQGLQSTLPTWINRLKYTHPFTAFWARLLFPFYPKFEPIHQKSWFFFWVNKINNQMIFLDLDKMYDRKDIENKNLVIWGTAGWWKSTMIRTFIHRNFINNASYFVIDPKADYTEHAKDWGWTVVKFSLDTGIPFNFFEVLSDYNGELEPVDERIAKITALFSLMIPNLFSNPANSAVFDQVIKKVYELDPSWKKTDMIKFYNVIQLIKEEHEKKDKRENYLPELKALKDMSLSLQPYVTGSYKNLLKFDKKIYDDLRNANSNYIVFDISALDDARDAKAIASFIILQYSWSVIKSQKWEHWSPYIIIDEAWDLLWSDWSSWAKTNQTERVANYLTKISRLARWYWAWIFLATQNAQDLLQLPAWSSIMANSAIQIMLKNLPTAAEYLQNKIWENIITNSIKNNLTKLKPWHWYIYYGWKTIEYRWSLDTSWEYKPDYEPKNRVN